MINLLFFNINMYFVYRRSFILAHVLLGNPNKYVYTNNSSDPYDEELYYELFSGVPIHFYNPTHFNTSDTGRQSSINQQDSWNVGLMFAYRLPCLPSFKATLGKCLVFAEILTLSVRGPSLEFRIWRQNLMSLADT